MLCLYLVGENNKTIIIFSQFLKAIIKKKSAHFHAPFISLSPMFLSRLYLKYIFILMLK